MNRVENNILDRMKTPKIGKEKGLSEVPKTMKRFGGCKSLIHSHLHYFCPNST